MITEIYIQILGEISPIILSIPSKRVKSLWRDIYRKIRPSGRIKVKNGNLELWAFAEDSVITPKLISKGRYEKHEVELLSRILTKGDLFIDVGANIGYYSLIGSNLVQKEGRIYSFEPEPKNFELLLENIKLNNITNIVPFKKALSNKKGVVTLFLNSDNFGNHSLYNQNVESGPIEEEIVESTTLDSFSLENGILDKVSAIKIDVEGAEGSVLDGGHELLIRSRPKILMEFNPKMIIRSGWDPWDLLRNLERLGYSISIIESSRKDTHSAPISINDFEKSYSNKPFFFKNLYIYQ